MNWSCYTKPTASIGSGGDSEWKAEDFGSLGPSFTFLTAISAWTVRLNPSNVLEVLIISTAQAQLAGWSWAVAAVSRPPELYKLLFAGLLQTATLVSYCDRIVNMGRTHGPVRCLNRPLPTTQPRKRSPRFLGRVLIILM